MTIEKICKKLIIKEPFWGLFMLGLNKRISTRIPTMAVAKSGIGVELLVNPSFWESLSDTEQMAILLHELHHLCFEHIFMGKDFADHERFNIACDAEVNCYIEGLPPNDGHVDCRNYGLEEKQGAKYYYNHLPVFQNPQLPGGAGGGQGTGQQQGNNGVPTPNLSDDHSTWKEFAHESEAEKELVKGQIEGMIKQAAIQTLKQRGTIPGEMQEIVSKIMKEKPRIFDWKSKFRRMLGTEIEVKLKKTYHRESKRFTGSPGLKFKKRVNVLVGVDTSGSVSKKELEEFFSEISHISKAGAKVTVAEFDARISSVWEFKGLQDIKITGRGGTDFEPMIEYWKQHKKDYTVFVLFTDGYAPTEKLRVPNNDMTWVITSEGDHDRTYPGKVLFIPKSPEE